MTSMPHSHLARPPHKEPPAHAPNAALLIDFDNVTMGIRSDLQTELKRLLQSEIIRGKVAVQRAYADWRRYPQYIVPLSESSIDLIFAPAYGSNKKNATDIRLAIDALELVFTRPEIGTFILLSGDSDFSSLVLKLKEYGKYVIGVGIRESSSDLLIQNCDEYFSYSELTGLTKTSDIQYERRDPWQLTVEAVKQMTAHNDVMRSDRLKQVMQELDPNFDEKDAGFSRFSKFVVEAAKRGFITLTRLDNGQYEVALGPESGGAPSPTPAARTARVDRGREAGPREEREPAKKPAGGRRRGFSLGEAFTVLRQAFGRVGSDEESVAAEELREAMVELSGADASALTAAKFPRLLRQAHDAEIIDLSKQEGGGYQVRLRAETPAGGPSAPSAAGPPASGPAPSAAPRSTRFRRGSRGGHSAPAPAPAPEPSSPDAPAAGRPPVDRLEPATRPETPAAAEPVSSPPRAEPGRSREGRSVRGRRGSRGRGPQPAVGEPNPRPPAARADSGRGAPPPERAPRGAPPLERAPRGDAGPTVGGARERGGDDDGHRRRRRGGRGRGGRERTEGGQDPGRGREPAPPSRPAPAPPPPAERPAAGDDPHGESFWSRVKRGLIGE